ncbi:MAG: cysteine desulfurase [Clostridiales bacterium]|nr:cysteine desulfurase [Clostridiales bacterium]
MIYLDYAATAPMRECALEAMNDVMRHAWGNPSSIHEEGARAKAVLEDARERIAAILGCRPSEILFTSGGTESDSTALLSAAEAGRCAGRWHIVTSAIEHHAVLRPLEKLVKNGFDVTELPPDGDGMISADAVRDTIRQDTCLVSVMTANNETGVLQPVGEIGELCRAWGIPFHTDAVQTAGHLPTLPAEIRCDTLAVSAHKFGGPRGAGFLYVRRGAPLTPLLLGGNQERGRRAGTENVAAIAGMAAALEESVRAMQGEAERLTVLRDRLAAGLLAIPRSVLNGHPAKRLPNNVNVSFEGVEGEPLILLLDERGIRASSGAACSAGALEPSHVLTAMGQPPELAVGSLRLTLGPDTDEAAVDLTVEAVRDVVRRLRSQSPDWQAKCEGKKAFLIENGT